jgi:nucleoside 2-deoxyribosyltransferase
MKLFCAYAFTGENIDDVTERMRLVVDTLKQAGHEPYCNLFDAYRQTLVGPKAICMYAFETLKKHDAVVAIAASERRSEGLLMEIGAGFALGKPVYLMQHKSAAGTSYLPELVEKTWVWETPVDLKLALQELGAQQSQH